MPLSFLPNRIYPALTAVSLTQLEREGIRLLMLDFDNTIVPYTSNHPTPEMEDWLGSIAKSSLTVCVVSNSRKPRVVEFCKKFGMACITRAKKPGTRGIRQCLDRFSCPKQQAALLGDQIYTDVLGANLAGVRSFLVPSIHNHSIWLKLRHIAELPFIFLAGGRRV